MTGDPGTSNASVESWSILARHDWEEAGTIDTTLSNALDTLDEREGVLYDHLDTEALLDVFAPGTSHGVSQVRFEYGRYEVRITRDGVIAARRRGRPRKVE